MTIFEYLEDSTPSFLVGQFTENAYKNEVSKRKQKLVSQLTACLTDVADTETKRQLAFQLEMIRNHRSEPWHYPIFCFHLYKKCYKEPHFHITKGYNKLIANYLSRRSHRDIPVVVINYGSHCKKIKVERQIYNNTDFVNWLGKSIDLEFSFIRWEDQRYPVIEQLSENKIKLNNLSMIDNWVQVLKTYLQKGKIPLAISDRFSSKIYDSSDLFQIVENTIDNLPTQIERTTHIREYKNSLRNQGLSMNDWTLVTNRQIKLDLFDIIWFLQDHASDYVSEDRSYSILGPGAFRADSVLPGSEL
jgi:hypothetical protein